jgi:hypothetical protein
MVEITFQKNFYSMFVSTFQKYFKKIIFLIFNFKLIFFYVFIVLIY